MVVRIMIFKETKLKGVFIIKPEQKGDERGPFTKTFFLRDEFIAHGLNATIVQSDISYIKASLYPQIIRTRFLHTASGYARSLSSDRIPPPRTCIGISS